MSNKDVDAMGEQNNKKRTLVPRLRFPEFREVEEWEEATLNDVIKQVNKKIAVADISLNEYISTENILPDYSGISIASKLPTTGSITQFQEGDLLLSNIRPYLKKVWFSDKNGGASNDVIVFRATQKVIPAFMACALKKDSFIDYIMKGAKGVKMPRGDTALMKEYPFPLPTKTEQQKIADCLSSLEELITAQTQKLDTLKAHKKGLMQQLFPREGETVPRLRFPEFRGPPDWEATKIGAIGSFYYGKSAPKWSLEESASTRCVRYGELYTKFGVIIAETFSKTNINPKNLRFSKGGEILVPRVGEKPEDFGKYCSYLPLANIAIGEMISVFETEQNPLFYTYYFRNLYRQFAKVVEGQNVKNLYYTELEPLSICRPDLAEQQRIADCLSSLDELITAQSRKLNALKIYKKGLVQQLFPVMNEAQR
jgi:type I restriction enzyme S subunit